MIESVAIAFAYPAIRAYMSAISFRSSGVSDFVMPTSRSITQDFGELRCVRAGCADGCND
mgnify:CR=1 FL=1|jgi:hypothetical protein